MNSKIIEGNIHMKDMRWITFNFSNWYLEEEEKEREREMNKKKKKKRNKMNKRK